MMRIVLCIEKYQKIDGILAKDTRTSDMNFIWNGFILLKYELTFHGKKGYSQIFLTLTNNQSHLVVGQKIG